MPAERLICPDCNGASLNQVRHHKPGCPTGSGGWSEAQRKAIQLIEGRAAQDAKLSHWVDFKQRLNARGEVNLLGSIDSYKAVFLGE